MSDGQWMQTDVNAMVDALKQAGDRYSLPQESRPGVIEDTHAPYVCEFCTTEHKHVSAMLACVEACAADRGRE